MLELFLERIAGLFAYYYPFEFSRFDGWRSVAVFEVPTTVLKSEGVISESPFLCILLIDL